MNIEEVVRNHNKLVGMVNEMKIQQSKAQQREQKAQRREQIEEIKEITTTAYSSAASYASLIVVGGYVAFFTAWNSMRGELHVILVLLSGLLILLSALLFIINEVYKMVKVFLFHRRFFASIEKDAPADFVEAFRKAKQEQERRMSIVWIRLFLPMLATGVLGGLVLIIAFGYALVLELRG